MFSITEWVEQYNYRVKRLDRWYKQDVSEERIMDEEYMVTQMWINMPQEAKDLINKTVG